MTAGAWTLTAVVALALALGLLRAARDGRFRARRPRPPVALRHGAGAPAQEPRARQSLVEEARPGRLETEAPSVLTGTPYDARRGERATLLQFSSAFCAPCRATRRTLAGVATAVPGVAHVEVDAEHELDLVRRLGVLRTPTTLVLDAAGAEVTRAAGAPRTEQVLAALDAVDRS